VLRVGGAAMIILGLLLVSGWWDQATAVLRQWAAQFTTAL